MSTLIGVIKQSTEAMAKAPDDKKIVIAETVNKLIQRVAGDMVDINERNDAFLTKQIPAIYAQLEAADKRTEKAANQIMTCAERMMPLLKDCPDPAKAELQKYINIIFEAGSFQDLVAQHVNEVRRIVKDVEEDASDIKAIMNTTATDDAFSHQARARLRQKQQRPDAHLLNGPSTAVD